jgi:hypothetical protein
LLASSSSPAVQLGDLVARGQVDLALLADAAEQLLLVRVESALRFSFAVRRKRPTRPWILRQSRRRARSLLRAMAVVRRIPLSILPDQSEIMRSLASGTCIISLVAEATLADATR